MAPCTSEIDISLIDRIRYLLNMQSLSEKQSDQEDDIATNVIEILNHKQLHINKIITLQCTAAVEEVFAETSSDLEIDFELSCPNVELILRLLFNYIILF